MCLCLLFKTVKNYRNFWFLGKEIVSNLWNDYDHDTYNRLVRRDVGVKWPSGILHYVISEDISKFIFLWSYSLWFIVWYIFLTIFYCFSCWKGIHLCGDWLNKGQHICHVCEFWWRKRRRRRRRTRLFNYNNWSNVS